MLKNSFLLERNDHLFVLKWSHQNIRVTFVRRLKKRNCFRMHTFSSWSGSRFLVRSLFGSWKTSDPDPILVRIPKLSEHQDPKNKSYSDPQNSQKESRFNLNSIFEKSTEKKEKKSEIMLKNYNLFVSICSLQNIRVTFVKVRVWKGKLFPYPHIYYLELSR